MDRRSAKVETGEVRGESEHAAAKTQTNHTEGKGMELSSPSSKSFPTASPGTRKGLFLCMGSLMPLDVLHTPKMKPQSKLICDTREEAERCSNLT